jgi:hypothetical protein
MSCERPVALLDHWQQLLPNQPMKLPVACGARSLSARR